MRKVESWGRLFPDFEHRLLKPQWKDQLIDLMRGHSSMLAYGNGRSYGDSCLNQNGALLMTRALDRFIAFDRIQGILKCEPGVLLSEILELIVPSGWFLPVTPGTKFVTVGGAVANDIHGKNHHVAGCFGNHVLRFELLRSDGSLMICSPTENEGFFKSTIGGLGLTGLMTWIEFRLKPITSHGIDCEVIKIENMQEFLAVSRQADEKYEYSVTWIDCLASRDKIGSGLAIMGRHAEGDSSDDLILRTGRKLTLPFDLPSGILNRQTVGIFNLLYANRQWGKTKRSRVYFDPFFYPLDAVYSWNRAYGRRGFFQYQFVVPPSASSVVSDVLQRINRGSRPSFLNVLKSFGSVSSPGLMSFPIPGLTLAIDVANDGQQTLNLLTDLDAMVTECGGRIYPAKDGRMSAETFRKSFPQVEEFSRWIDPKFSSSFWRRVWG